MKSTPQAYWIERDGGSLKLYRFDESESFEEWCEANIGVGLDLPSEDEWEYLYGAGCRTLFPWGSEIGPSMRPRHLSPDLPAKAKTADCQAVTSHSRLTGKKPVRTSRHAKFGRAFLFGIPHSSNEVGLNSGIPQR
ncbi:hypothetical protein [Saccharibacillus deserti]|uniref:hypothetical protein n=1 Tax=Saccharibacillus deserti TaxID=1634444 RepID=UPI00155791D6|nr:hypothetical protein [Saccharibacillus deserti]